MTRKRKKSHVIINQQINPRALIERIRIKRLVDESLSVMLQKNTERGSCSDQIGLLGLFLEIRTTYLRLRSLVWDISSCKDTNAAWQADVKDVLMDMRNYTILAELALIDKNMKGIGDDSELSEK